ncbi:cob(II)yrinic acid a,c-diamide reductase [Candidatus Thiomargarita nelsonii]|uniref:5,6-dimethylbenzimidazole synthase n=1 Tax=Candidatus Thiomargarita nelsonii TaxID=1003181 RepID=A0A4E0QMC0_9GAMM|nr:cob(II)yrinic acid a,c-diamide reductase [Candidatus Thiomargarita nelsonii]
MLNELITKDERDAVYKTIFSRRDVRKEFLPDPIQDTVLQRILMAAHHAPSVGFMQPWNFIIVRNIETRKKIKEAFVLAHEKAAQLFDEEKSQKYRKLKLEGITEAPLGICVTCDRERNGPIVIGRTSIPETDIYSSVCAVQNLWIAARAENLGVGWVSIIDNVKLKKILGIPNHVVPVAYLCLGHVSHFQEKPDLERTGWLPRLKMESVVYDEKWPRDT